MNTDAPAVRPAFPGAIAVGAMTFVTADNLKVGHHPPAVGGSTRRCGRAPTMTATSRRLSSQSSRASVSAGPGSCLAGKEVLAHLVELLSGS